MSDEFDDFASDKISRPGDSYPKAEIDRAARSARKDYEHIEDSGELDTVTDQYGPFLAKMYVCAEHFGVLTKFKKLIEDGMRLRPDNVMTVAKMFDSLSLAYGDVGDYVGDYRRALERDGHLVGKTADSYYAEFDTLTRYLHKGDASARRLAENTSDLMAKFAEALVAWRKTLAKAIEKMAEYDRNTEWAATKGFALGLITGDPFEAARNTLETLMNIWERADAKGKSSDAILRKFSEDHGFKLDDPKHNDVSRHDVVLTDPWDGSFA